MTNFSPNTCVVRSGGGAGGVGVTACIPQVCVASQNNKRQCHYTERHDYTVSIDDESLLALCATHAAPRKLEQCGHVQQNNPLIMFASKNAKETATEDCFGYLDRKIRTLSLCNDHGIVPEILRLLHRLASDDQSNAVTQ